MAGFGCPLLAAYICSLCVYLPTNQSPRQAHVAKHLKIEGGGATWLVLWLDCDREGENICFEVIDVVVPVMGKPRGRGPQVGLWDAGCS